MPVSLTRPTSRRRLETFLLSDLAPPAPLRGPAGFELARRFASLLGDPQDHARQVHVVGTAGKGTAALAITDAVVSARGCVGTHMSPHVYDVRERFLVDGRLAAWSDVLAAAGEVHAAAARLQDETGRLPGFFAATAALSWVLGRRAGVELHVTEAGIGGRHDASNVIRGPGKLTVITNIGVDHADVLGSDVGQIAAEKAAVVEPGGTAVVGPQSHPEALEVVARTVSARDARLVVVDQSVTDWWEAATAVARAVVAELGFDPRMPVSARLPPGRGEVWVLGERRMILDGAHNPLKLEALRRSVAGGRRWDPGRVVALVAIGAGKDLGAGAAVIAQLATRAVVTEFGDPDDPAVHPRSWPAVEVAAALAGRGVEIVGRHPDHAVAADLAWESVPRSGSLLVTGSFFHLAGVRKRVLDRAGTGALMVAQSTPR